MNGREWGPDDTAKVRRLTAAGLTQAQIGEAMERHRDVIREKCQEHGIEPGISRAARAIIARLNLRRRFRQAAA